MLGKMWLLLCMGFLASSLFLTGCGGSSPAITISIAGTGGITVVDGGDKLTLTATVSNDSSGKGITWTVSGGGTLSSTTGTTVVYTAPATPTSTLTVTVTATSVADTSKSGKFTITVPPQLTITTTSAQLSGTAGVAFSKQLASTTGSGTLTWKVDSSSSLPTGWSLTSGGLLTGPASNANTSFSVKIDVTDSGSPTPMTASVTLTVTINPVAITFTATPTATATVGTAYSSATAASGGTGTLTYSLANSTTLPAGLHLNTSTGAITGNPTTSQKGGLATNFTIQAADSWGDSQTQSDTITVSYPTLSLTNPGALTAYNGTAYTSTALATVTASGGSGGYSYSWAAQSGSSLPPGLSINSSTGQITGTPTSDGTYNVTATATDSATETATANFAITVKAGVSINSVTLPTGYVGSTYTSTTLTATGGAGTPYTWTWAAHSGSSIPSGLSISTGGAITGTPATGSQGTYSVDVTAKDSANNSATSTFSITIDPGVTVNAPTIPTFYPGDTSYATTTFTASGGSGSGYTYTWAAASGSTLPSGLSLSSGGTITGTPTNSTTSNAVSSVVVTAQDGAGNKGTVTVSITILAPVTITTSTTLPTGVVGTAYSQQLQATGGNGGPYTWTLVSGSSNLTTVGLSMTTGLNAGLVEGATPIAGGPETFAVTVSDGTHTSTQVTFSVTINASLSITTATLSPTYAYGGSSYTGNISAAGGASPYTWSIPNTSPTSASTLASYGLSLGSSTTASNSIAATTVTSSAVTTTTTLSILVQVKDNNGVTASQTYSLTLYPQLMLTSSLPSVNENATITTGQETVTASGGSAVGGGGGYSFTVSGLPSGLTYNVSGNVVDITGTAPSTPGTYQFTVTAKDTTTNVTIGSTNNESITVNSPGQTVSGNISISNTCGGTAPTMPTTTVKLMQSSTVVQTTTTTNGSYSFSNVAAGSYTIVPSYTGTGISSAFYPSQQSITVASNNLTNKDFAAAIGYTVTGAVNYSSTNAVAGQIYLNLVNNNCSYSSQGNGTSIATTTSGLSGAAFTIQGVPPGTYTLKTWEDPNSLGNGAQNANDPVAPGQTVTVGTASTSVPSTVALANPTYGTPTANPQFQVTQVPNGVLVFYKASTNSNNVEDANAYMIQWSTSSTLGGGSGGDQFLNIAGSQTFKAVGANGATVWILTNNLLTGSNKFTVGQSYYFQARSFNTANSNAHPSGWFTTSSATQIVSTATPCTGTCTSTTSSVTIPSGVTISSGAPLYAGFFQNSNSGAPTIYATQISSPTTGSALSYTISIPSGSGWVPFGILDQNNDGLIDGGDDTNIRNNNSNGYSVSGSSKTLTGATLPSTAATMNVATDYYSSTYNGGSNSGYSLSIEGDVGTQQPVAVELISGPNIMAPIDLSNYCEDCGNERWEIYDNLNSVTPAVGDTYTFKVWYLGNSTPVTVTGNVVGWNGGGTLTGAGDIPTSLSPAVTASTQPTFSWSLPGTVTSSDVLQFWLNDDSINNGSQTIWQIPGNNSNANGLASTYTSLTWNTDPSDNTNTSSESTLNPNNTYTWQITVVDENNNQAQAQTWFIP